MGLVNFSVPEIEVEYLRSNLNLDVFVEGGTYKGDTAKHMSGKFETVYTIEKSNEMFNTAKVNLKDILNIIMIKGDTREHLHNILDNNDNILFWLDSHWSGGDTYGEEDECPLIDELKIIFKYKKNYAILIDDARLFLAPPPYPHNYNNWPSITNIIQVLPNNWELLEFEDVFYLIPKIFYIEFKTFMHKIVTNRWEQYGKNNRATVLKGVKIAIQGLLKGKIL